MAKPVRTNTLKQAKLAQAERDQIPHHCLACGTKNKELFHKSRNPIHRAGRQPYCRDCLAELFVKYQKYHKEDYKTIFWHLCRKIDMGFAISGVLGVYTLVENAKNKGENLAPTTIVGEYMKLSNAMGDKQGYPVCFDDSDSLGELTDVDDEEYRVGEEIEVTPDLIKKWGKMPHEDIQFLEDEYRDWCYNYTVDSKSLQVCVKEICYKQLELQLARSTGAPTGKILADLQTLMSSASLKPSQETAASAADQNTIGLWIKKIEEEEPIKEPTDEFKDPDNIAKLFKLHFLGHFMKMLGMENNVTEEYEEEMNKYTVDLDGGD